jgi:hypothetical protein
MAPGALPRPGRGPEQRLLSPKICLRRRWSCGTLLKILPIDLGFLVERLFIGEGASSGGDQGVSPQGGAARGWAAPPHGGAGPWPPSGSRSVFDPVPRKIGVLELISSDSENISCVAFSKHKKRQKTGNWHCGILLVG